MKGRAFIRFVLIASLVVLAATLPLAWWIGERPVVAGTLGGFGLGIANFWGMAWLIQRLLYGPATRDKRIVGLILAGKMGALIVVAWLLVAVIELDVYGFVLGFSAMVVSLFIGGFWVALGGLEEHESQS